MIEHDHVEAEPARELERLMTDGAAIDGDEERRAVRRKAGDRLAVRAITLGDAVGDVYDRFAPARSEIFARERRAAGAVDVVVAEDRDPFAALDRMLEALCRRLHVAQAKRVRHQVAQGRIEIALHGLRLNAAPREHAREEFVLPADLRDGERAKLARAVQARAPRPAERRALDVKKVAGHPSPSCIARLSTGYGAGERSPPYPANRLSPAAPKNTMPESAVIQKLVGQSV